MDLTTIDTYNRMAVEYDAETSGFWGQFPRDYIQMFADSTESPVLSIGSGPGRDALLLQERGLSVTCLDASEAMVALSSARGLTSVVGDFCALPFADESFGGVWAYTALLHVPKGEVEQAFSEIRRVLKPDGTLGLGLIEGAEELYRESAGVKRPRWFSFYTREETESLLRSQGFTTLYFEEFQPGSKKYLNFICRKD